MDQLGQNPPPTPKNPTPQNPPQAVIGQPAAAAAVVPAKPPLGKTRKPYANKKRQRSIAWDHFVRLPDEAEPIAACKHCHIRFRCDSQIHEFQGGVSVGDGAVGVSSSSQSQPINIGSG